MHYKLPQKLILAKYKLILQNILLPIGARHYILSRSMRMLSNSDNEPWKARVREKRDLFLLLLSH